MGLTKKPGQRQRGRGENRVQKRKKRGERHSLHGIFILRISANLTSRRKNRAGTGAGDRMKQQKGVQGPGYNTLAGRRTTPACTVHTHLHNCQPNTCQLSNSICVARSKTHRKACGRADNMKTVSVEEQQYALLCVCVCLMRVEGLYTEARSGA